MEESGRELVFKEKNFQTGWGHLRYHTMNDKGAGPTLLFVGPLGHNPLAFWGKVALGGAAYGCKIYLTHLEQDLFFKAAHATTNLIALAKLLVELLNRENVKNFHVICWCSGFKLALALQSLDPKRFRSLLGVTVDYNRTQGPLLQLMEFAEEMLSHSPNMGGALVKIVEHNAQRFLGGPTGQGIYEVNNEVKLKNFFWLARLFREIDMSQNLQLTHIPIRLLYGDKDMMTPLVPEDKALFRQNCLISYREIAGGSHYLPLDFPQVVVAELQQHVGLQESYMRT